MIRVDHGNTGHHLSGRPVPSLHGDTPAIISQSSQPGRCPRSFDSLCSTWRKESEDVCKTDVCNPHDVFPVIGSLVYEYFSKLHLADLAFEALLIPTIDSCRRCLRHLQNKECAKITMCESEAVCLIWMGYIIHFEVQTTSLM